MMSEHPIQGLMSTALQNIKEMVDVNTIVGDAVESPDGSVIIPISKVSFGFAAGGSEFGGSKEKGGDSMFGGGSGGGVTINPVAFMVVGQGQIKLLPVASQSSPVERIIELVPDLIEKANEKFQKIKADKGAKKKPDNVKSADEE